MIDPNINIQEKKINKEFTILILDNKISFILQDFNKQNNYRIKDIIKGMLTKILTNREELELDNLEQYKLELSIQDKIKIMKCKINS